MSTTDTCCTIVPYFKVNEGQLDAFKALCEKAVEVTQKEEKCLYYGFSFSGNVAFCREGYEDSQAALQHLDNVGPILKEMFAIAELTKLEVHGPAQEIESLREPLAVMSPEFFTLEYGFRQ